MANEDRPRGARAWGEPKRVNRYEAGSQIQPGDLVKLDANGQVVPASVSNALIGAAICSAASGEVCSVSDDPDQKYLIQADESDIDAQTDIGLNYNIVATASDSNFRISRMELDSSTGNVSAVLPLKLLDIDRRPDNEFGAQVDCVVAINNHQLKGGTGTAGV